jgi:hypothetical protein
MKHTFTVIVVMIMGLTAVSAVAQTATNTETLQVQNNNEIRLYELGTNGANYTAFKAAGSMSGDIKYTLPSALPTTNQVLSATAVSGTDVTLGWANASGSSVSNYHTARTSNQTVASATNWQEILSVTPAVSKTYMFRASIRVQGNANNPDFEVRFTVPASTTVSYTWFSSRATNLDQSGSLTDGTVAEIFDHADGTNWRTYEITGVITVSSTSGAVAIEARRNGGSGNLTFGVGSNLMLFQQ